MPRPGTASDLGRLDIPGSTASGIANATQLVEMTPFTNINFGQTATELALIVGSHRVVSRAEQKVVPLSPFLNREDEPMLRVSMEAIEGEW